MVALFILILLSALSFCDLPVVQHYYIRDMLRFEPFFVLGYLAKSYPFVLQSNKHGWSLMLLFFVTFPVLFFIVKYTWIPLYISTYIGGISGTICVLAVAKWFDRLPFFSYVGRNSLIILVTHLFLMTVLALSFKRLGVPLKIRYVIILITLLSSYYLIIPFVKRWLSPLLGQKTTDETYS